MQGGENAGKVTPKNSLNYMIALILGVVIPILIILLIDFFNNRIIDKKDIEDLTNVAIIGSIGHNSTDSDIPVAENSKSAIAESFRSLRTNIQYLLTEHGKKIISVSSTITGEGKTFVATNLAFIIAMSNKKTLLLGLDMRKPKIYKDFSIDNETGMSTYLINKSSYEEIIHPTESDNLWVTTSGPFPPNPAELLETERLQQFFEKAKKDFDYIVIDTPPVAIVTDAILLTKYSDTNIFVVRQNFSNKNVVLFIDELYNKKGLKNITLLVNDIKIPSYYGSL